MTNGEPDPEVQDDPTAAARATEQPAAGPATAPPQQKVWVMPPAPVGREHADKLGRVAVDAASGAAKGIAIVARFVGRTVAQVWRAVEAVPRALLLFIIAGLLLLVGVTGAIAVDNTLGLFCTVVVIPVSAIILGALGQRWYGGVGTPQASHETATAPSELQRSVEYVDKKLAVALTTFGTERHQQAVIALFQAKTAVELTLGTEQDTTQLVGVALPDESRPRIRVGSNAKSMLRESDTLAAS